MNGSPSSHMAEPSGDISFVDAQKGRGIYLDGIDDFISLGITNFVDRLTISLWIKLPKQQEYWQPLIAMYDEININNQTKHTFYLKVLGKQHDHRLYFAVSDNSQLASDITSETRIAPQIWYHVVAMFQAGKLLYYINGEKEAEKNTDLEQLFSSTVPIMLGSMLKDSVPTAPFAHVMMDELRLYNRNLSESEIDSLYKQKSGPEILSHAPTGIIDQAVSYVDIYFDTPIISSLLMPKDFLLYAPNQLTISVKPPEQISQTSYRFTFDPQTTNGSYTFQLGPQILDDTGNALNQDGDQINGEMVDDVYYGEFRVNATPDNVLMMNISGANNDQNSQNIYEALLKTDANAIYISLSSSDKEDLLIDRLTQSSNEYHQVWVYDSSEWNNHYPKAIEAISNWFQEKQGRQIICDGRMRASFWHEEWKTNGQDLAANYYMNLKINGGGLLLATDHPDDQPDINGICEHINISPFGKLASYYSVQTDSACHLMSYPKQLNELLDTTFQSSMVPTGLQPNNMHLYCVAWAPDNVNNCSISTTIRPLMPGDFRAQVNGNSIDLFWKSAQPAIDVTHYNVYISPQPFSVVSDLKPYSTTHDSHLTIPNLEYGKVYYLTSTAVNKSGKERQYVLPISVTTASSRQGSGDGGCFLTTIKAE